MTPPKIMFIAGETSGDLLAADLVRELKRPQPSDSPASTLNSRFFGAGGPQMREAGVHLALDLTAHSVIGLSDALRNYLKFRRFFRKLFKLALEQRPEIVVCVDFSGFNRRFAHALKNVSRRGGPFHNWDPKIVQYVSPQVWASRENRAYQLARDLDLLLCILPFEKAWYARKVPELRVEFVGHPICDRYSQVAVAPKALDAKAPLVLLLPGSRRNELRRHLLAILEATRQLKTSIPGLRSRMILPNQTLLEEAKRIMGTSVAGFAELRTGSLAESLAWSSFFKSELSG